jgi:hypothetical protein
MMLMLSATEAATVAYFSQAEAATTWAAMRAVAAHVRPYEESLVRHCYSPTQALPDSRNIADTIEAVPTPQQEPSRADAIISQLIKFERLADDWDGYGAAKPDANSIRAARAFIRSLSPESVVPQPALHADGNAILFLKDTDAYVELEFLGSKVEFFARRGDTEWASEFSLGMPLPAALSEIGFST